jgi:uncharacterized protein YkwD
MFWALFSFLIIFPASAAPAKMPTPQPVSARMVAAMWEEEQATYDPRAERELLDLANRTRVRAELTQFKLDEGLSQAARKHAIEMAMHQQLSHQFSGELALSQRLAESCKLYLVEAAENVASADSADRAHDGLMHSPPHRENLLHPSYNAIGIGVVRRGGTLYVVQDFGNSVSMLSEQGAESAISKSIEGHRSEAKLPPLELRMATAAHKQACAMSKEDSLKVSPLASEGRHIFRYTSIQPANLPDAVIQAINDGSVHAYTVGSCFARTKSYPNGIYWVVLIFY